MDPPGLSSKITLSHGSNCAERERGRGGERRKVVDLRSGEAFGKWQPESE